MSTTIEGTVLHVRTSDQRMPQTLGRHLASLSLAVFVVSLGLGALLILIVASVFGCAVTPVLFAVIGAFVVAWRKLVLKNDTVQQTSFDVVDSSSGTLTPVVHFSDRGGTAGIVDGDYVAVIGTLIPQASTLISSNTEIRMRAGLTLAPPARLNGKQPMSTAAGLVWLLVAALPIIWLVLSMSGRQ